jgi:hypothetical protein
MQPIIHLRSGYLCFYLKQLKHGFVNFDISVIRLVKLNCKKTKSFWEIVYCLNRRATAEAF